MQPSSYNNASPIMPEPAHHEHAHRQIVIVGIALLGLVVLAGLGYQYMANKKIAEQKLRAEYNAEQVQQSRAFFEAVGATPAQPMTDAEKKELAVFFAQNSAQSEPQTDAEMKAWFNEQQTLAEQDYQEWKAARQQ